PPALLHDGDARIVGDLLSAAVQRVEQRRLAAIGISDEGDDGGEVDAGVHGTVSAETITAIASRRRSAMVVAATRTAIGSPPNRPWCRSSTAAPSSKPSTTTRRSTSGGGTPG